MSGSDSAGTTMGVYDTTQLPLYTYLHEKGHPHYAIADDFFQAAFGGSFLNHQWLIAAASPVDPTGSTGGAHAGSHSIIDSNGMPTAYPLYTPTGTVLRNPLTVACTASGTPPAPAQVCGNWAVNTMQPTNPPAGRVQPDPSRADGRDDRRPPLGRRPELGVVFGWLGERHRRHDGSRLHRWAGRESEHDVGLFEPDRRHRRPQRRPGGALAGVSGRALPVPPSAVRVLRELRPERAGTLAPAGRGRTSWALSTAPTRSATSTTSVS